MTRAGQAVVFAGQGCQVRGMGAQLHEAFEVVRWVYAEASEALDLDVAELCFTADRRLHLTEFTQPCILTTQIAAFRAAQEQGLRPVLFGGHSLGEYTALVAAGVLDFAAAVRIVRQRGALMQRAVPVGQGTMAALLLDDIARSGAEAEVVAAGAQVANVNSPSQLVISGTTDSVEAARLRLARALPDLTFVPLQVSAPFHSDLMKGIEGPFRAVLEEEAAAFERGGAAVVTSNYTGGFHAPDTLLDHLVAQISAPVRWLDNMAALGRGARRVVEVGPRPVLTKLFAAVGTEVHMVGSPDDVVALRRRPGATLGDPSFLTDHGAQLAYVIGGLGWGVGTAELVQRAASRGVLAFLGTDGLSEAAVHTAVAQLQGALSQGAPWGVSVRWRADAPEQADALLEKVVATGVRHVEVSGYPGLTQALVRARLCGARLDGQGRVRPGCRLLAKVPREDLASRFLGSPPERLVAALRAQGLLTPAEAALAPRLAMADDVCAEADGGGHRLGASPFTLLPAVLYAREAAVAEHGYAVRVGAAGGLGDPRAVAGAFAMGADFVLTGSVHTCSPQSAFGERVQDRLAAAVVSDFAPAPTVAGPHSEPQLFLKRGSLFVARSHAMHRELGADGAEAFQRYLDEALQRARATVPDDEVDVAIRCGSALGAFNRAVQGTPLQSWQARDAEAIAWFLMDGAAQILQGRVEGQTMG